MQSQNETQKEIQRLKNQFLQSSDFTAKEIGWGQGEQAILCFYSSLVKKSEVERYVHLLRLEHKKALRAEENKKVNNSQQTSNKTYINQKKSDGSKNSENERISNNEKQKERPKMSDSSKSSDHQGSNSKENQKEQQKMSDSSKNNDHQGSNGSEKQEKQQKMSDGSKNSENEGISNNENQKNQPKMNDSSKSNDNQGNNGNENQTDIQTILYHQKNNAKQSNPENDQITNSQKSTNAKEDNQSQQQEDNSQSTSKQEDSMTITTEKYDQQKIVDYICNGETIIILPKMQKIIRVNSPESPQRTPDEPENEQILRGAHEGLIENIDSNIALIRKRVKNNKLIVKTMKIGTETKTGVYYLYMEGVVDKEALKTVEKRLQSMNLDMYYSIGQLNDHLDDNVWSPFPQLLNTERPDRVVANILEGKIAVMTDISPTAIIGPVTFFSFYQSPDDFNSRVLIGTFYRILRIFSLLVAVFLPAIYIAVVSFHFEVIPLELANKVKMDINQIPYRPLIEALIMEITIELIREASVRLPKSIGQTIGIVGGLVIGDSIVSAGLVSNLMVIVVAFTAISSFVVPSIELNTAIRVLRFPLMVLASLFGFFGIMIGTFILVIHLLNLSSLKQPYFSPLIPFQPKEMKKVFFREPYYRANKQVTSFSPKKDDQA